MVNIQCNGFCHINFNDQYSIGSISLNMLKKISCCSVINDCQCMDKVSITSNQSKFNMHARHFTHDGIMEVVEVYTYLSMCVPLYGLAFC